MTGCKLKKILTIFGVILVLNFIFFTIARAQDLEMAYDKKDGHPKLASNLWELGKEYKKGVMAARTFAQSRNIRIEDQNTVEIYLISEPGTTLDETSLQAYGVEVIKKADNVLKARVPISVLETVADNVKGASFIKLPDKASPSAIESEGVSLTGAASLHSAGYRGLGVKVAVIDVGFAGLSFAISVGELPNTLTMLDCTGPACVPTSFYSEAETHGTAVAEIVHDMAPEAQLYLIKISDSLDLKDAKDYCIANGIKIINHSAMYHNTNFYSGECYNSNPVCTANDAYSNGILWINAMGNDADKHYEATFTDPDGDGLHNVSGVDVFIDIEANAGEIIKVFFTWNAWPTTDQDYDILLFDSAINLVAKSNNYQTGTQEPVETISFPVTVSDTYKLSISADNTTSNHRLEVYSSNHKTNPAVASSSIANPADAISVMAVGAVNYQDWSTGPVEPFSSQGPTNDGRTKPDISGPDGVSNSAFGDSFLGTSAASPHVAGICALVKQVYPNWSPFQLKNFLESKAINLGIQGKDNVYGSGLVFMPEIKDDYRSEVKAFVTRFYRLCLSRDPDQAGLDGWVSALVDGTQTGSGVANGFVFSQEFINQNTTDEEYLKILYEAFFNRKPDPVGLQAWLDAIANGSSREDVLNGFIYSTEFANLCDEYGIKAYEGHITKSIREAVEDFVTRFYQLCLDRNPDPAGLEGWTNNLLNQIQTGADVAHGFIDSKEFLEKNTTNDQYLTILYRAFFDRDPDSAGYNTWLAELNDGKGRGYVLDGFLYSQEFAELCQAYGINPY